MKKAFMPVLALFVQGISFVFLLIAGLYVLNSLSIGGDKPSVAFQEFAVTGVREACSEKGTGEIFNFKLPKDYAIAQLYISTNTSTKEDKVFKFEGYGEKKGYENLGDHNDTSHASVIALDPRNRLGRSLGGMVHLTKEKLFPACENQLCICLLEYRTCKESKLVSQLDPIKALLNQKAYEDYKSLMNNIINNAYPDFTGANDPVVKNTMNFDDAGDYEYIGTAKMSDIPVCKDGFDTEDECRRSLLQIADGFTRQLFAWQLCADEMNIIDCQSLRDLDCEHSVRGSEMKIADMPLMVKEGSNLHGFWLLPADRQSSGISIQYMQIKKSDDGTYLYISQRTKG